MQGADPGRNSVPLSTLETLNKGLNNVAGNLSNPWLFYNIANVTFCQQGPPAVNVEPVGQVLTSKNSVAAKLTLGK